MDRVRKIIRVICCLLLLALAPVCTDKGCNGSSEHEERTCTDSDGDGYYLEDNCGTAPDCDDDDPDNWSSCDTCTDNDNDSWFVDCNAFNTRNGPDCNDGLGNAWDNCMDCADQDADGWGAGSSCHPPLDCDDSDPLASPGGTETMCDGKDNDCDPGTPDAPDQDADGYDVCDPSEPGDTDGYFADCDDSDIEVNPGHPETQCDAKDNDCDPATPDWQDWDGDGYDVCDPSEPGDIDGLTADCDDQDPDINPGQAEIECDGKDNDCDSSTPDWQDLDGDGYDVCDPFEPGDVDGLYADCNDSDPSVHPGSTEVWCDGKDNDCDPATPDSQDSDQDGYDVCDPSEPGDTDGLPADTADDDPAINPGVPEVCDCVDNNCDGLIDEGCLAARISAGGNHSCAAISDGSLKCWGMNASGELGDGSTASSNVPVCVQGVSDAISVACGRDHACAVLSSGEVMCWGSNDYGQLGNGDTAGSPAPVSVLLGGSAQQAAAGGMHTCALVSDGSVECWGYGKYGQLGDGSTVSWSATPVSALLPGGKAALSIAAGGAHTCAVLEDGGAVCWGYNGHGQLGNGTTDSSDIPVAVSLGATEEALSAAAGWYHSCVVLADGRAKCFGQNNKGQLGDGTLDGSSVPVFVVFSGDTVVNSVSGGGAGGVEGAHTCACIDSGAFRCWGHNNYGQLGDGSVYNLSSVPVPLYDRLGGIEVSAGRLHSCAILSDGGARCWGRNDTGQLGNGTTGGDSNVPVDVLNIGP